MEELESKRIDNGSTWNRTTTTEHTTSISATDPLFNKYVVIGVLAFFVTVLALIVLVHVIRILRRRYSQSELLYGQLRETFDDSVEVDDDDDDDLVDLYTSCQLYVDNPELNTAASDDDLDCVSVAEGERGSFVNEPRETEQSKYLEQTRGMLSRHFQRK